MSRTIEIRLNREIAPPLVDIIRQQVSKFEQLASTTHAGAGSISRLARLDLTDLHTLAELFHPDFPNSAVIRLSQPEVPAVLRACTLLRFDLRRGPLAPISDAAMESGEKLTPDSVPPEIRPALMCYLFLATIQELALEHFTLPSPRPSPTSFWQRLLGGRKQLPAAPASLPNQDTPSSDRTACQVVVLNDCVNLMNYVSVVFRHVIGLPQSEANARMREVHEAKESIVWTGDKAQAESYVAALQSWHLNAVLRLAD